MTAQREIHLGMRVRLAAAALVDLASRSREFFAASMLQATAVRWGFDPARVIAPVLFLHGGRDRVVPRSHSQWLASRCRGGRVARVGPEDGHISVLNAGAGAIDWLADRAGE